MTRTDGRTASVKTKKPRVSFDQNKINAFYFSVLPAPSHF